MSDAMSDERLAEIDGLPLYCPPSAVWRAVGELRVEVDRLRSALARVLTVHTCVAPSARPMCDYDGEAWPCATAAAMGEDAFYAEDAA